MTEEKDTSSGAGIQGPETEDRENTKKKSISNITMRILGLVDLGVGLYLYAMYLPHFIRLMYVDKSSILFQAVWHIVCLIFWSSVLIGILLIAAGICLAFTKSFGLKIHNYIILPLGSMIGIMFIIIGINTLIERGYRVPYVPRYILFGLTVLLYSITTYLLLRKYRKKKKSDQELEI